MHYVAMLTCAVLPTQVKQARANIFYNVAAAAGMPSTTRRLAFRPHVLNSFVINNEQGASRALPRKVTSMSLVYSRVVAVGRQVPVTGGGLQPYSGMQQSQEMPVVSNLPAYIELNVPASVQLNRERGEPEANLPADGVKTLWRILIPTSAVANGVIQSRDILTDDLGKRYQVLGPGWNSLGYDLLVELLEA